MNIFVAIPVYDGKLPVETVASLLNEKSIGFGFGDDIVVQFLPSCSHPAMGRNQLVHEFLKSGFDKLVFVDSDLSWEPGALIKLAHYPVDYVGGAYRYKFEREDYPILWKTEHGEEMWANDLGLLEVKVLPAGFTSLSRNVFETIRKHNPNREYSHLGITHYCYFQTPFDESGLHSEESYFAKLWRDAGGQIFLDPEIALTHWNFVPTPFHGHIGNWLKSRNEKPKQGEVNVLPEMRLSQGL